LNCPNCGKELQIGENQCPFCLAWVGQYTSEPTSQSKESYDIDYISDFSQRYASSYDPTVKPKQIPQEIATEYKYPELILTRYQTKGFALALSLLMCVIGTIFGYIFFDLFDLIPILGIFIVYLLLILPIIASIAIRMGYYTSGGILLIIGSAMIIPIGLIGIYGGLIALKLARVRATAETKKPNIDPNFFNKFHYPTKAIKAIGSILIIISIIIPTIYFSYYLSQPQLRITSEEIEMNIGGEFDIDIKNVGYSTAKSDDIKIKIINTDNRVETISWTEGDIKPLETSNVELSLPEDFSSGEFKIAIYYKDQATDIETFQWKYPWE